MKYILGFLMLFVASTAHATLKFSSFTAADTGGTILFSSQSLRITGITVGIEAAGNLTIYRSTSPNFTTDITSQTAINTGDRPYHFPVDFYNSSYTYINKEGAAAINISGECVGRAESGFCPELHKDGKP